MAGSTGGEPQDVVVDMLPEGRAVHVLGAVADASSRVEDGSGRARRIGDEVGELVDALERALSAARRLAEVWQERESQAGVQSQEQEGVLRSVQNVRRVDAVDSYYCTILVADPATLRHIIEDSAPRNEFIVHECPTSVSYDNPFILRVEHVGEKNLRCGCPNKNCRVYQYTNKQAVNKEHRGA